MFSATTGLVRPITQGGALTDVISAARFNLNAGAQALAFNAATKAAQISSPTVSVSPAVGSQGSTGLKGGSAFVGRPPPRLSFDGPSTPTSVQPVLNNSPLATSSGPVAVGGTRVTALSAWQMAHPNLDAAIRVGGIVAGILLWRHGHKLEATVAAGAAGVLWINRFHPIG